jgi:ribonuclease P protein component
LPSCTFKKSQRLLNASDFKGVFEHNKVKVANDSLLILAKPARSRQSRLGLVIAKKNIPNAVQRNRLKRVVRETFRQQEFDIPMDIVFLARSGANRQATKQLTPLLRRAWTKLVMRSKSLRSESA